MNENKLLAVGGLIGALAASSCCVAPLAFAVAGLSGAWIGRLTMLAPYQPVFFAAAGLCVALGLWRSHRAGGGAQACTGTLCAETSGTMAWPRRATRAVLWVSALLLAVSASAPWWAPMLG